MACPPLVSNDQKAKYVASKLPVFLAEWQTGEVVQFKEIPNWDDESCIQIDQIASLFLTRLTYSGNPPAPVFTPITGEHTRATAGGLTTIKYTSQPHGSPIVYCIGLGTNNSNNNLVMHTMLFYYMTENADIVPVSVWEYSQYFAQRHTIAENILKAFNGIPITNHVGFFNTDVELNYTPDTGENVSEVKKLTQNSFEVQFDLFPSQIKLLYDRIVYSGEVSGELIYDWLRNYDANVFYNGHPEFREDRITSVGTKTHTGSSMINILNNKNGIIPITAEFPDSYTLPREACSRAFDLNDTSVPIPKPTTYTELPDGMSCRLNYRLRNIEFTGSISIKREWKTRRGLSNSIQIGELNMNTGVFTPVEKKVNDFQLEKYEQGKGVEGFSFTLLKNPTALNEQCIEAI